MDKALIDGLQAGFPLCDRPFAQVGRMLGLAEADVIERLGQLLAVGRLVLVGPLYRAARLSDAGLDQLDRQLIEATQSGLPLVPEPFEAIGALLGVSASEVQARLAAMLERGVIRQIGAIGAFDVTGYLGS